ncbi:uncharacterized protein TA03530 [Theileria annulata]|uniref:GPI mannosyltransferase 2 n=1 Tax=Theileria annulata TaxID=5874 RepID=Q4UCJ0_THEAN|nr:uncharacterized protein TA03530 [Theileria annulata]CAI75461.1 hypothetical protein, conserved [Theileria annulata]|eukprot:XP_954937.1 hypothetical protein, conserved [Theileria annulata]
MKNVILKLVLLCLLLRFSLITFAILISNFPRLHIPKYQYDVSIINNNFNYKDENKNKYLKIKSKRCLKGNYSFPITNFFGFLNRNNNFDPNTQNFNESNKVEHEEYVNIEKLNRFWLVLIAFVSWDGERFLINSLNELIYLKEESCAFFPFYSYLLNLIANFIQKLLKLFDISFPRPFLIVLIGFILNNILSVFNNVLIYLILSKNIFTTESYSRTLQNKVKSKKNSKFDEPKVDEQDEFSRSSGLLSTLTYTVSPGFIFTTSLYTEPLYTALNYSVLLLVYKLNSKLKQPEDDTDYNKMKFDKSSFNQLMTELFVVFLIFVNCLTRSNAILLLIPFSLYLLKTLPLYHLIRSKLVPRQPTTNKNKTNLKPCDPNTKFNFITKFVLINLCYLLKFLLYLYVLLLPFLLIQLYGYKLFCNQLTKNLLRENVSNFRIDKFIKNNLLINPISLIKLFKPKTSRSIYSSVNPRIERDSMYGNEFCRNGFNLIYKHVQSKYWGLKLFYSFDSFKNFTHFLYTLPNFSLVLIYLFRVRRKLKRKCRGFINFIFEFIENYELNLILHLIINFLSLFLFSHIQIFFRQSLTLIQFVFQFTVILHYITLNKGKLAIFYKLLYIYNIALCFVGIILFSNFIGWT